MDPLRIITYVAISAVFGLVSMGGLGFYIGYSAGRGDLAELKSYLAGAGAQPQGEGETKRSVTAAVDFSAAPDFGPLLEEIRGLTAQLKRNESNPRDPAAPADAGQVMAELRALAVSLRRVEKAAEQSAAPDLAPVLAELRTLSGLMRRFDKAAEEGPAKAEFGALLTEVKAMGDAVKRLEKTAQQQAAAAPKEDPKLREELGRLRQLAASAGEQLNSCQLRLTALETRQQQARTPPPAEAEQVVAKSDPQPVPVNAGSLIFSDSFYLKKDETKAIQDVNLAVALIGVSSRSARVEINKQPVSVAFGERKEIVYNSMTCEFSLIETDLNASQARFSLSCKR